MMLLIEPGIERLFTWDDAKNEINVKKHGISFEKASDVFSDPHALSRVERIETVSYTHLWVSLTAKKSTFKTFGTTATKLGIRPWFANSSMKLRECFPGWKLKA